MGAHLTATKMWMFRKNLKNLEMIFYFQVAFLLAESICLFVLVRLLQMLLNCSWSLPAKPTRASLHQIWLTGTGQPLNLEDRVSIQAIIKKQQVLSCSWKSRLSSSKFFGSCAVTSTLLDLVVGPFIRTFLIVSLLCWIRQNSQSWQENLMSVSERKFGRKHFCEYILSCRSQILN